ncbi:hypothetical protein, partial [Acinetobacter baumannii]|uniref:hypothetical protein n=1 Tax=Acinetobacter baumannii TaxID=470 RepID=UPI001C0A5E35
RIVSAWGIERCRFYSSTPDMFTCAGNGGNLALYTTSIRDYMQNRPAEDEWAVRRKRSRSSLLDQRLSAYDFAIG